MVALNTAYASSKTFERSQNRVGDFFCEGADCVGNNKLGSRIATKEKNGYTYETASGRPFWPNRDPLMEYGGENLYCFILNQPIGLVDLLGRNSIAGSGSTINPNLGNFNPEKTEQQRNSNCAGTAVGSENSLTPSPQALQDQAGCTRITNGGSCPKDLPRKVIFFAFPDPEDPTAAATGSPHVIGQECGLDTYQQQTGIGSNVYDGITDPNVAADAYYDELEKKTGESFSGEKVKMEFCCPCRE